MKKLVLITIIFINIIAIYPESKPIVQIDPIINMSKEVWLDALCIKTADSVSLTLKLLGQFIVSTEIPTKIEDINTEALRIRSEANGYDNIIFGSCSFIDGNYIISMNAYDRSLNKITYSDSTTVESIFDTLDAIDQIIDKTVEGFSGIHVTYGSLDLLKPESGEPLSFTIDDVALAEGTFTIDKMPAGKHKLTITQDRYFGKHIVESDIFIQENIVNKIPFPITRVTIEEADILNKTDRDLANAAITGDSELVALTKDLKNLLSSQFYSEYRPSVIHKYDKWISLISSKKSNLKTDKKIKINKNIESIWIEELPQSVSIHESSIMSQYEAEYDITSLKKQSKIVPEIKTISIDGNDDDWLGVLSGVTDRNGDAFSSELKTDTGIDLSEVKVAIDTKYLYIMVRTSDEKYVNNSVVHKIHLHGNGNIYFDFHLYDQDKLHVGMDRKSSSDPDEPMELMDKQVKFKTGKILEFAIPLKILFKNPVFTPSMGTYIATEYNKDPRHDRLDHFDNELNIIIPFLEILTRKESSI
ncbi:MAG: hypothetical protein OCD02_17930 [Spirochaetaceae bacterium]